MSCFGFAKHLKVMELSAIKHISGSSVGAPTAQAIYILKRDINALNPPQLNKDAHKLASEAHYGLN